MCCLHARLLVSVLMLCSVALQLHWQQGRDVQRVWAAVGAQVLHPHLWVRGAVSRLLGLAFAEPAIGACLALFSGDWLLWAHSTPGCVLLAG